MWPKNLDSVCIDFFPQKITRHFIFLGALKPVGHCCYEICGAVLHIQKPEEFNTPFDLNEINEILETILHPKKAGENEAEKEIEIGFIHKGTHTIVVNLKKISFQNVEYFC